jgi:hypothetical protein
MLYQTACEILDSHPRPRVRVILKTGQVLETPGPLLAAVSPKVCAISTDGEHALRFRWEEVAAFEKMAADAPKAKR